MVIYLHPFYRVNDGADSAETAAVQYVPVIAPIYASIYALHHLLFLRIVSIFLLEDHHLFS